MALCAYATLRQRSRALGGRACKCVQVWAFEGAACNPACWPARRLPTHPPQAVEELNLTREQFVDLCILCGCDYTGKIGGIGPVRALQVGACACSMAHGGGAWHVWGRAAPDPRCLHPVGTVGLPWAWGGLACQPGLPLWQRSSARLRVGVEVVPAHNRPAAGA